MIIKKEEEKQLKEQNKNHKNILKLLKKSKVIIIIVIIVGIIVFFDKKFEVNNITIDLKSDNISYEYGPSASTKAQIKAGQEIEIKIISNNDIFVKCYSTNDEIIEFTSKTIAKSKKTGNAQIYCKNKNKKSNLINVIIGE